MRMSVNLGPGPPGVRPGGRRRPPRPVEVRSVERLTARLVSVVVGGESLRGLQVDIPAAHVKVLLPGPDGGPPALPQPGPGGPVWPADAQRPVVRTYTPRRVDADAGTMELQFVLHGEGPAARWAGGARVGDQLAVAGPGGRFSLDLTGTRWWTAADESALPALCTVLEALPGDAEAEVHVEVDGPADEIPLPGPPGTTVTWHHRAAGRFGMALEEAAQATELPAGTQVWVAGEATAVRRIRRHVLDAGVPVTAMTTRGYWRLGESDHPDHDYGEDD